jgi:hypothetical protein
MREALLTYGINKRIDILPTGLPAERFRAGDGSAFRRRHGLDPRQPLLLFVGRAAHEKNIGFLLEMMLELRSLRCDALLQGVPVVAIPRMGTIDILGPGLGCRHAPDDRKGFARVVQGLLTDRAACAALGEQARRYAHTWASIAMAQRLSALYASLAA